MNHKAARARRRSFALALVAFAAGALACSLPAYAGAETPTTQASYYGLDWVPYIDPADLPPLDQRPAVCIVDTGAAVTPDLPADDVNGHFIARWALDGGSGTPLSTSNVDIHGTLMATYAFGADNGWGITGIFPQGRVLQVRAQTTSNEGIYYALGAKACRTYSATHSVPLAAVSMSLGSPRTITPSEQSTMSDEIANAHSANYSIVAAAGNDGSAVNFPGSYAGVFTAAAGVVGGSLCNYASYGAEVEIAAPACNISDVDPFTGAQFNSDRGGSSMATAVTAATISLLRTMRPTASYSDIEYWIVSGASMVDHKPILNGTGAMHAAGLDDVVTRAKARMTVALNPPNSNPPATAKTLRSPRARVSFSRGFLRVKVSNRPAGAKLVVRLIYRGGEFASKTLKRSTKASRIKIRSRKRPWRVQVNYLKGTSTSPTISFRDRRTSTFVQLKSTSTE